jgi:hypothetical protein
MKEQNWRPIAPEESKAVEAIVSASGLRHAPLLLRDLDGALVRNESAWILEVKAAANGPGASDLRDGPLPARAYVRADGVYQGEIIIWLSSGHVSGLEYAWVTDQPPTRWPRPDEIEVVTQRDT